MNTFEQLKAKAEKEYEQQKVAQEQAAYELELRRASHLGQAVALAFTAISEREGVALEDLQDYTKEIDVRWYSNPSDVPISFNLLINFPNHLPITIGVDIRTDDDGKIKEALLAQNWHIDRYDEFSKKLSNLGKALVWANAGYQEKEEHRRQIEAGQFTEEKKSAPRSYLEIAKQNFGDGAFEIAVAAALISLAESLEMLNQHGLATFNAYEV